MNGGMTACGIHYTDSDYIAALAIPWFRTTQKDEDSTCGRLIKITEMKSRKSIVVTVEDECESCQQYDIDVTPTAFQQITSLTKEKINVNWTFI